jgi:hypothetical protein
MITDVNPAPESKRGKRPSRTGTSAEIKPELEAMLRHWGLSDRYRDVRHWQRKLAKTNRYAKLMQRFGAGRSSPLFWGLDPQRIQSNARAAIELGRDLWRDKRRTMGAATFRRWESSHLSALSDEETTEPLSAAMMAVHTAQLIAEWIKHPAAEHGWRQLAELRRRSEQATADEHSHPLVEQWLGLELPLTLAFQLPELGAFRDLATQVNSRFSEMLPRWLDEDGMVDMRWWSIHRALLAGWVRCCGLIRWIGMPRPSAATRDRIGKLYRQSQRASLAGGQALLVEQNISCGWRRLNRLAAPDFDQTARRKSESRRRGFAELGSSAERSGLTLLRSSWRPGGTILGVQHIGSSLAIELVRKIPLLQGECMPEVWRGEKRLKPDGKWDVTCWFADEDVQTLDLEIPLEQDAKLNRTIVLGVADDFLLIADAVTSETGGPLRYVQDWPLAPGIRGMEESETREVYLKTATEIVSLVLPLSAPEWKSARGTADLELLPGRLTLRQSTPGGRLYAPLFFDLRPKRSIKPRTWRPLTVAGRRKRIPADNAVGFRVRIGGSQWIIFRSFGQQEPYSVLSMHLMCEFFLGRLEKEHSIHELIRIE